MLLDDWCLPAVCERGDASFFFEEPDKVVGVLDAYRLADLHNLIIGVQQHFFCLVNADFIQVLHGGVFIILRKFTA